MTEHTTIERETITEHPAEPGRVVEKDYATGVAHGDEEAGGAFLGGAAGAVAGAIGAASGATVGALDQKAKDDTVVVTREVRRP